MPKDVAVAVSILRLRHCCTPQNIFNEHATIDLQPEQDSLVPRTLKSVGPQLLHISLCMYLPLLMLLLYPSLLGLASNSAAGAVAPSFFSPDLSFCCGKWLLLLGDTPFVPLLLLLMMMNWLKFPRWIPGWVSLYVGGRESLVFGSIRWCVWSFRPSTPLQLPYLSVCYVLLCCCCCFTINSSPSPAAAADAPVLVLLVLFLSLFLFLLLLLLLIGLLLMFPCPITCNSSSCSC